VIFANAGVQRPGCRALRGAGAVQVEHRHGEPGSSRVRCNALLGAGPFLDESPKSQGEGRSEVLEEGTMLMEIEDHGMIGVVDRDEQLVAVCVRPVVAEDQEAVALMVLVGNPEGLAIGRSVEIKTPDLNSVVEHRPTGAAQKGAVVAREAEVEFTFESGDLAVGSARFWQHRFREELLKWGDECSDATKANVQDGIDR